MPQIWIHLTLTAALFLGAGFGLANVVGGDSAQEQLAQQVLDAQQDAREARAEIEGVLQ